MSKTKISIYVFVLLALGVAAFMYISKNVYSLAGNRIVAVKTNDHIIRAEVVFGGQEMQLGLGGRSGICDSCGMLFKFLKSGKYSFWMKGMNFPLDIIWISQNKIVHIEKNVKPDFSGTLNSAEVADTVLEINARKADDYQLKVGDWVSF